MSGQDTGTEVLTKLLSTIGYQAERLDDAVVQSSFSATSVFVQWYSSGSIQLVAGWNEPPESFDLGAANAFNAQYRFGSVSLDEDALTLQANFFFDPAAPDAEDVLRKAVKTFEGLIQKLLAALEEAVSETRAEASAG